VVAQAQSAGSAEGGAGAAGAGAGGEKADAGNAGRPDDIVDAEFEEVKDKKGGNA
jgi:hypothetical protein